MAAGFRRSTIGAAALLATLGVCAACTESGDSGDGTGAGARKSASPSTPAKARDSLFGDGPVAVALKKGQPGFTGGDGGGGSGGKGGYTGFDVALTRYLSRELGFTAKLHDIPPAERERDLASGATDLVVGTYTITEARDQKIDFTAPYLKTFQGLMVRSTGSGISKLDDVRGKRVCSAAGTTSDPKSVPDQEEQKQINETIGVDVRIGLRADYQECVDDLRKGRFDAVWTDKLLLESFALADEYGPDVKVVPDITIENRQFYGIGIAEGHKADCRRLNDALRRFLAESWRDTFQDYFPDLAAGAPDFEQEYKPTDREFEAYAARSCGAR